MINSPIKTIVAVGLYCTGLIKVVRWLGRNYPKILVFHSVSDYESYFIKGTNVWTSTDIFAKHLQYIMKNYNVVSLRDLVESLKQGKSPKRTAVITFDDGFADNYYVAYPILKRYKIPATIFLATDCIDNKRPIWIQELYFLINRIGIEKVVTALNSLNNEIDMPVLKIHNNYNERNDWEKTVELYLAYSVKRELRNEILERLYHDFELQREEIFSKSQIFLSWDQVRQMSKNGVAFGNHGASHTPLSAMTVTEQKEEIMRSKEVIEKKLGETFLPFSYPFGGRNDFTPETKQLVIDNGHSCSLTAMATLNSKRTSLFDLGRIDMKSVPVPILAFEMEKSVLKKIWRGTYKY